MLLRVGVRLGLVQVWFGWVGWLDLIGCHDWLGPVAWAGRSWFIGWFVGFASQENPAAIPLNYAFQAPDMEFCKCVFCEHMAVVCSWVLLGALFAKGELYKEVFESGVLPCQGVQTIELGGLLFRIHLRLC